jgi:hypothetical protein
MKLYTELGYLIVVVDLAISGTAWADIATPSQLDEQACSQKKVGDVCDFITNNPFTPNHHESSQGLCSNDKCDKYRYVVDHDGGGSFLAKYDAGSPYKEHITYDCVKCSGTYYAESVSDSSLLFDAARDGSINNQEASNTVQDASAGSDSGKADCGCKIRQATRAERSAPWCIIGATSVLVFIVRRNRR